MRRELLAEAMRNFGHGIIFCFITSMPTGRFSSFSPCTLHRCDASKIMRIAQAADDVDTWTRRPLRAMPFQRFDGQLAARRE